MDHGNTINLLWVYEPGSLQLLTKFHANRKSHRTWPSEKHLSWCNLAARWRTPLTYHTRLQCSEHELNNHPPGSVAILANTNYGSSNLILSNIFHLCAKKISRYLHTYQLTTQQPGVVASWLHKVWDQSANANLEWDHLHAPRWLLIPNSSEIW